MKKLGVVLKLCRLHGSASEEWEKTNILKKILRKKQKPLFLIQQESVSCHSAGQYVL